MKTQLICSYYIAIITYYHKQSILSLRRFYNAIYILTDFLNWEKLPSHSVPFFFVRELWIFTSMANHRMNTVFVHLIACLSHKKNKQLLSVKNCSFNLNWVHYLSFVFAGFFLCAVLRCEIITYVFSILTLSTNTVDCFVYKMKSRTLL